MLEGFVLDGTPLVMFWLCVAAAILIQGISKSGFAGGAGILSLPLMMLVMPVTKVSASLLPLLILCDMNAIYHHRHNKSWKHVMEIYLPALIGIAAGGAVWWVVKQEGVERVEGYIKQGVGLIAILFAIYILAKESALEWVSRYRPGKGVGAAAGVTAGFTSTIAHAAGPIVSLFVFAQGLGKTLFVGTVAWTFTLINLTKLPIYLGVGLIDSGVVLFDLVLIPLIPIGSWLGKWMHHRVSERAFNLVIMVLVFLTGVNLIFKVNLFGEGLKRLLGG
jgi:hypothetical protein